MSKLSGRESIDLVGPFWTLAALEPNRLSFGSLESEELAALVDDLEDESEELRVAAVLPVSGSEPGFPSLNFNPVELGDLSRDLPPDRLLRLRFPELSDFLDIGLDRAQVDAHALRDFRKAHALCVQVLYDGLSSGLVEAGTGDWRRTHGR